MSTPLCPALLAAHAASMVNVQDSPINCMPRVIEGSACLGSRCVKWVPETKRGEGVPAEGGYASDLTGNGWCSDNLRRAPFADPSAPTK